MKEYIVEINYLNGRSFTKVFKTDKLQWTMEQYQRNRVAFEWKVVEDSENKIR